MTNEEKVRLVLETLGVDNVKAATKAMKDLASGINETYDAMDDLSYFSQEFAKDVKKGIAEPLEEVAYSISGRGKDGKVIMPGGGSDGILNTLLKIQNMTKGTAFESVGKEMAGLGQKIGKNGDLGRGFLELSYLVDDLQYGFRGIVNNVPRIAQAFGVAAGAVGAIGIAVVGVNQVINILWKLLPEGEKPLQSLKEKFSDFAQGMGASKLEAEKLSNEIEKMANKAVPGLFTSLDTTIKKIREVIAASQELEALKKEQDKRAAAAEAEKADREKRGNQDQDKGKTVKDFVEGLEPNAEQALADKVKKDQLQKGRNDAVAEELAALERGGAFADTTIWGMAVPFLNRGGTALSGTGRAEQRRKMREDEARKKLQSQITEQSPEAGKFAGQRADEIINKAKNGDREAMIVLQGIAPELAEFIKQEEADKEFDKGIEKRSAAVQKRNEARAKQQADEKKMVADTAKEKQALNKRMADLGVIGGKRLDDGTVIGGDVIDDKTQEAAQQALQKMTGGFKQNEAETKQENEQQAAIRNALLGQFDPLQAAIVRRQQVGRFGTKRGLAQLEKRDIETLTTALMQQGMGRGEAEDAAMQSLKGGEDSFQALAKQLGQQVDTVGEGFQASVMVMQKLMQENAQRDAKINQAFQQIQAMGNGDMRAPARPQMQRRMGR